MTSGEVSRISPLGEPLHPNANADVLNLADLAPASPEAARARRLASFDALRGFAVLAMAVDHLVAMVFLVGIEPPNVRFLTRIAEPLFAVLLGYFLAGRARERVIRRGLQVFGAAALVNPLFYPVFGKVEILATFVLVLALYSLLEERFAFLAPLFLLHAFDPTGRILNYPLAVVAAQVALGMLLKRGAPAWTSLAFAAAYFTVEPTILYSALFTIPAVLLLKVAERDPAVSIPVLGALGRRPLLAYITQWALVFAVTIVYGYTGGRSDWFVATLGAAYRRAFQFVTGTW